MISGTPGGVPRRHHHAEFPAARLAAGRERSVTVCLPARDEAATIGPIVEQLVLLQEQGVIDQVLVADDSTDQTAALARAAGAEVVQQAALHPELGPVCGKGDAMWRALAACTGDVVCFLDADTRDPAGHFACGLLGPLLLGPDPRVQLVKGAYRRPWRDGAGPAQAEGGGRVTELAARPLLRRFFPEVAWLRQPLAGEVAAPRALWERLPFTCGYGVDVALLLDAVALCGPDAVAEVDLDVRQNRHQPLEALGAMSDAVLDAVLARVAADGRLREGPRDLHGAVPVRPPRAELALQAREAA